MSLRMTPWARDGLRREGAFETAVRLAQGRHVRLSARSANGPYVASGGRFSTLDGTAIVDASALRAVERVLEIAA